jgi:hypothetical protein
MCVSFRWAADGRHRAEEGPEHQLRRLERRQLRVEHEGGRGSASGLAGAADHCDHREEQHQLSQGGVPALVRGVLARPGLKRRPHHGSNPKRFKSIRCISRSSSGVKRVHGTLVDPF